MKCTIPSERLAAVAFGLMALLIVSVFALMATVGNNSAGSALQSSISNNSNCGLARSSGINSNSPTAFLEGVGYNKLRSAVIHLYHASDPETTDIDDQFEEALAAMSLVERDGHPVPIDGVDGLYVGSIGE